MVLIANTFFTDGTHGCTAGTIDKTQPRKMLTTPSLRKPFYVKRLPHMASSFSAQQLLLCLNCCPRRTTYSSPGAYKQQVDIKVQARPMEARHIPRRESTNAGIHADFVRMGPFTKSMADQLEAKTGLLQPRGRHEITGNIPVSPLP